MVEFDDGDRGRISLANIRLLPPGYQICCEYDLERRDGGGGTQRHATADQHFDDRRLATLLRAGAEPSPALLVSPGHRGRRGSAQERKDTPAEKATNEESAGRRQEKRPGDHMSSIDAFCHSSKAHMKVFNQL